MAKRSQQARDEKGAWDIGGGGLDFGLTASENVRKEVMEEYAAETKKIDFIGYRDVMRDTDQGVSHWVALDFAVLVDGTTVKINEPHKFDDSGWFDMGKLPSPLHSQVKNAFEKYSSQLESIVT